MDVQLGTHLLEFNVHSGTHGDN